MHGTLHGKKPVPTNLARPHHHQQAADLWRLAEIEQTNLLYKYLTRELTWIITTEFVLVIESLTGIPSTINIYCYYSSQHRSDISQSTHSKLGMRLID